MPLKVGIYRAMLATKDRFGKTVTARQNIQVVDTKAKQYTSKLPSHFSAPKWSLAPGESFLATSGARAITRGARLWKWSVGRLRHLDVAIDVSAAKKSLTAIDAWMDQQYRRIIDKEHYVPGATDALHLYAGIKTASRITRAHATRQVTSLLNICRKAPMRLNIPHVSN
jgi:hypothetical protein